MDQLRKLFALDDDYTLNPVEQQAIVRAFKAFLHVEPEIVLKVSVGVRKLFSPDKGVEELLLAEIAEYAPKLSEIGDGSDKCKFAEALNDGIEREFEYFDFKLATPSAPVLDNLVKIASADPLLLTQLFDDMSYYSNILVKLDKALEKVKWNSITGNAESHPLSLAKEALDNARAQGNELLAEKLAAEQATQLAALAEVLAAFPVQQRESGVPQAAQTLLESPAPAAPTH